MKERNKEIREETKMGGQRKRETRGDRDYRRRRERDREKRDKK